MSITLRHLLLSQAARLHDRPALTTVEWGTLSYLGLRNKVEGLAFGLAVLGFPEAVHSHTGTSWDWIAELAAGTCGLRWDPTAEPLPTELFGGPLFQVEAGRRAYHDREGAVQPVTPFTLGLTQEAFLVRLRRINTQLGWDHTSTLQVPPQEAEDHRATLWCAFWAGSHALMPGEASHGKAGASLAWFRRLLGQEAAHPEPLPAALRQLWTA